MKMKADPEESIKQFEDESFWLNLSASENLYLLLELENSGTVFGHKMTELRGVRLLLGGDFPLPVLFGVTVWICPKVANAALTSREDRCALTHMTKKVLKTRVWDGVELITGSQG